jgi:PAS domain S-box-containing protein
MRWIGLLCQFSLAALAAGQTGTAPRAIKVVMDDNYPPFVFKDRRGQLQGITIDQWRLWEAKTGIKAELAAMDWGEALRRMQAGEFDVIDTIFTTEAREKLYDFSPPYARIDVPIFFQADISGITGLDSLRGFPVAAKTGDAAVELLQKNGVAPLLLFNSYEAIIAAAKAHQVHVFVVDRPPALYLLNQQGIAEQFHMTGPVSSGEFHRAVRKGNTALLETIQRGFAAIPPAELRQIDAKWYGQAIADHSALQRLGLVALAIAGVAGLLAVANWTLRHQVRERTRELRASEERWKFALEGAGDGVWDLQVPTRAVKFSKRWKEMLGYAEPELSDSYQAWFDLVHPDDRARTSADFEAYVAGRTPAYVNEHRLRTKDGRYKWILARGTAVTRDAAGTPLRMVGTHTDITERRQIEDVHRESEARLLQTFRSSPVAVIIVRPRDRVLIDVNDAFSRLLGWSHAEAVGRTMQDLKVIDPAVADHVRQLRQAQGSMSNLEVVIHARSGEVRHVISGMETIDLRGEPHVVATFVDITERKRAELHIRQLNRTLAVLSDINQLIVREKDLAVMLESACRIAVEKGGFRMAWIGRPVPGGDGVSIAAHAGASADTLDVLHALVGDRREDCQCAFTLQALSTAGHAVCNDIATDPQAAVWRDAALQRGYRAMASLPLKVAGAVTGTFNLYAAEPNFFDDEELRLLDELASDIGFALEVHALEAERRRAEQSLRASEERFRELAENVDEIFWITTPEKNQMHYVSPAYETVWGRTCASLYADPRTWLEAVHAEDRERVLKAATQKQTLGTYHEEYRIVRPDGEQRWILDRAFPVRDARGTVTRIVGVARDITARRQLEAQFRQSQKMEGIGLLAGGVAHDFNNILAAIMMQASLARLEPALPAATRDILDEILGATERAANLTRQLLAFSRRQVMQPRQLNLNEIVTSLTKMLQRVLGEHVRLQLSLHPRLLLTRADAGMLDQILLNLIINARDAMPGGGTVAIETGDRTFGEPDRAVYPDVTPGRHVFLRVTDTGTGIAPENLSRVFEPFFTTKEPGQGTGLGLATVFGIVKQHGGLITLESERGRGSTFTIFLPADEAPAELAGAETAAPPLPRGTETILVVEDEEHVRTMNRAVLEHAGYRVLDAAHGPAALELWAQADPKIDLLLTDIVMPEGLDGRELAARLQAIKPALKVIFTSGYSADIAGRELVLQSGQRFLQKPYTPTTLLEVVRQSLDT